MDAEHASSQAPNPPACAGCARRDRRIAELENQVAQLTGRIAQLEQQLAAATRASKRQAAPFSKGPPKANPRTPGRNAGKDYGPKAFRSTPPVIDEIHDAPLPKRCPCGGVTLLLRVVPQYQTEIPRRPIHRQFNVHIGQCMRCGQYVQGRHPLQTSDALGCCASQLGPDAQAAIAWLNKDAGLSHGKISTLFSTLFGIPLTRGGVCQAMLRTAGKCLPHYHAIILNLAQASWIVPDETGWRVAGCSAWLHTFVTEQAVAFLVAKERGFAASSRVIPEDYAGVLGHDGFKSYERFFRAQHQTCNNHLLRRCHELLETARGGAVIFPRKVKAILQEGLAVRDRRDAGEISARTAARKADQLQARMAKLTEPIKSHPANERFAAHLFGQQLHLFTYLRIPGVDATNYRAEQALKGPIVNRKVWGGNRTEDGAAAQGIISSVLGTLSKKALQAIDWISGLLRAPAATPLL
ncbi:MAG: IS66 family transposase, partial [Hyphomicrobiaceae bacterium]